MHQYNSSEEGIEVPVTLGNGGQSVDLIAKLDTGAANCIFERRYAEILGINPESGRLQRFRTMTGSFAAYEHEVTLQVLKHRLFDHSLLCPRPYIYGCEQEFVGPPIYATFLNATSSVRVATIRCALSSR